MSSVDQPRSDRAHVASTNELLASGLEVDVWFRCLSTEELWRFAQALEDPSDGSERVPPPPGRRNMIRTWTHLQQDPDAEPWHDAMLYGLGQAQYALEIAFAQDIDVEVYAIRIQPENAEFEPPVPATTEPKEGLTDAV